MASASFALQQAVFGALTGSATIASLLGGPKVFDAVPQRTAYPYITIGQSIARDWSTASDDGHEHILTFHVWSDASGRKAIHEIMAAVRAALHDQPLTPSGYRLVNLRHELSEARREIDGETYHGITRYRAVTEPLA